MDRIEGIATGDTGLQTKGLAETASGIVKQDTAHILPGRAHSVQFIAQIQALVTTESKKTLDPRWLAICRCTHPN